MGLSHSNWSCLVAAQTLLTLDWPHIYPILKKQNTFERQAPMRSYVPGTNGYESILCLFLFCDFLPLHPVGPFQHWKQMSDSSNVPVGDHAQLTGTPVSDSSSATAWPSFIPARLAASSLSPLWSTS